MNDDTYTLGSGHLDVGDGHRIYYQQWGNPKALPIFYLHGGPGSGSKDRYKIFFDPKKHHVVFHDQRGSGKSTPFASTANNTTRDLVHDIEKLRENFRFEKVQLIGGSWGSALGLIYAITHPTHVSKILLWGIYTGRKHETDYIQLGRLRTHFPDTWEQFDQLVPRDYKKDTSGYYIDKIQNGTMEEQKEHIKRWVLLESAAASFDSDYKSEELEAESIDENSRSLALLEAHYFINNCFIEDDFVFKNAKKIARIPSVLVQGRFDHVCPPETAYELQKRIGQNCHLHLVPASHAREGALRETVRAYAWSFLG